ncbi:MAG: hypothetical protein EOM30_00940 [Clostridia bacterium]|nr:hypothetical protein [Clostridia bacterium]
MKISILKRVFAVCLTAALCLSMAACSSASSSSVADPVEPDDTIYCTAGGTVTMPDGFEYPDTAGTMALQLDDTTQTLAGNLYILRYKTSKYYFTTGTTMTFTITPKLTDTAGEDVTTKYTDANVALWKKGDNVAEYIKTVHFAADGTTQTYTFEGLEAGAEYRFAFTYTTSSRYRVSGNFNFTGISGEGSEDETAAAEA